MPFIWQFEMRNDQLCKIVCKKEKFTPEAFKNFKDKIDSDYRVNMWVIRDLAEIFIWKYLHALLHNLSCIVISCHTKNFVAIQVGFYYM